jgi:hypothetical protein
MLTACQKVGGSFALHMLDQQIDPKVVATLVFEVGEARPVNDFPAGNLGGDRRNFRGLLKVGR